MIRNLAVLAVLAVLSIALSACVGAVPSTPVSGASATPAAAPAAAAPNLVQTINADIGKAVGSVQVACQDLKTGATVVQIADPAYLQKLENSNKSTTNTIELVCAAANLAPAVAQPAPAVSSP